MSPTTRNEAMTLADQIVLLKDGHVLRQASPRQLYNHPAQRFGGWFLGSPGMSFLNHTFDPSGGGELKSDLFPFPFGLRNPKPLAAKDRHRLSLAFGPSTPGYPGDGFRRDRKSDFHRIGEGVAK